MNSNLLVDMRNIHKEFFGVPVLEDVNFDLRYGEVHCLVGENGAGKSTLIKVLSGVHKPEEGTIHIDGKKIELRDPHHARGMGISTIYQELEVIDCLSICENIFLGSLIGTRLFSLNWRTMQKKAEELLVDLGFTLDVTRDVSELSVSLKQIVAIVKALAIRSKVIIMDEPSAVLTGKELQKLFQIINNLKSKNISIIYISHRLEEIFEIADRVTVLRDGKKIITKNISDVNKSSLIEFMVGRTIEKQFGSKNYMPNEELLLSVHGLSCGSLLKNISFTLKKGEILGFSGLVGAGRTELAKTIIGEIRKDEGVVEFEGKDVNIKSPRMARDLGIGYIPEDRKLEGLVTIRSVRENLILTALKNLTRYGVLNKKKVTDVVSKYRDSLQIKCNDYEQDVRFLSGGNQQKIVLAKWLAANCKVLILDEPTRGIDIGAKSEIYRLVLDLAKNGLSIILISSELPEILNLADRIYVMSEGEITKEFSADEASQEIILKYSIPKSAFTG